jgi:hypothetical protein
MNCQGEILQKKEKSVKMIRCTKIATTQRTFKDSVKFVEDGKGGTTLVKFDETQNFCAECAAEYDEAMTFRLLEATI